MKIKEKQPPRTFNCGINNQIEIKDCAEIELKSDEQVTFMVGSSEYDVTRKSWGYYATPSLNSRLVSFGFRGCLVRNKNTSRRYIFLMQVGKEKEFQAYLDLENIEVVSWLDEEILGS